MAAPVAAQVVVVPLDPLDPSEVITPDPIPQTEVDPLAPRSPGSVVGQDVTTVEEAQVATGNGAVLRGLDKLAGVTKEFTLREGERESFGWLDITLGECRYPVDNPSGDAFAWLEISEGETEVFEGWMVASSPALNALDHARFDVWVINCTTE